MLQNAQGIFQFLIWQDAIETLLFPYKTQRNSTCPASTAGPRWSPRPQIIPETLNWWSLSRHVGLQANETPRSQIIPETLGDLYHGTLVHKPTNATQVHGSWSVPRNNLSVPRTDQTRSHGSNPVPRSKLSVPRIKHSVSRHILNMMHLSWGHLIYLVRFTCVVSIFTFFFSRAITISTCTTDSHDTPSGIR